MFDNRIQVIFLGFKKRDDRKKTVLKKILLPITGVAWIEFENMPASQIAKRLEHYPSEFQISSSDSPINHKCLEKGDDLMNLFPNLVPLDSDKTNYKKIFGGIFEFVDNDIYFGIKFEFSTINSMKITICYESDTYSKSSKFLLSNLSSLLHSR